MRSHTALRLTFPLLALLLIGSAYGALCLLVALKSGGLLLLDGSPSYSALAHSLNDGSTFTDGYRPPLYSVVLATLYAFEKHLFATSTNSPLVLLFHLFCGVLSAGSLAYISYRLTSRSTPAILTLLLFLSYLILQLEFVSERETALFLFLSTLIPLIPLTPWKRSVQAVLLGLVVGLAHLTRPTGLLFVPLFFLIPLFPLQQKFSLSSLLQKENLYRALLFGTLSLVVFALVILPWQHHLYHLTGKITLSSSTTKGLNLYKGNNPHFDELFPKIEIDDYEDYLKATPAFKDLTETHVDTQLEERGWKYIQEHPGETLRRMTERLLLFLSPFPLPLASATVSQGSSGELQISKVQYRNTTLLLSYILSSTAILLGVFLYGVSLWRRRTCSREELQFLVIVVIFGGLLTAVHTLTFPESRFRFPLDLYWMVLAGIGYETLLKRRRSL
jgi:hypothetical protein